MRIARLLSILLLLGGLAAPAAAQTPKEQATKLFREGNELFNKGEFTTALEKFRAAKALYSSYRIDLNIASTLKELGRDIEAANSYEDFMKRGAKLAPAEIIAAARTSLEALQAKLGRVELSCNQIGAQVKIDDKPVGKTPLPQMVYLEPGGHQLEVCKPGFECYSERLPLAAGDRKLLEVQLQAKGVAAGTTTTPPAGTTEADVPTVTRKASTTTWRTYAGWSAVGVGGASLITGIILGTMVSSKKSEYEDGIKEKKPWSELQKIKEDGDTYESAQIAMLVVGGVALAAGAGLLLWEWFGTEKSSTRGAYLAPFSTDSAHGVVGGFSF